MRLDDLNLLAFGNSIMFAGAVFNSDNTTFIALFPGQELYPRAHLDMDLEEWKTLMRQLDLQETEVLLRGGDNNIVKGVLRKTQRVIEQRVSWAVYRRDEFHCRYCWVMGGDKGAVLTVDHLVLWEEGGPSIQENLVTACRNCNKKRGNMQLVDWLRSDYYAKVSRNLPVWVRDANDQLPDTLADIPRRYAERKRR
jgi:hypothetical protein